MILDDVILLDLFNVPLFYEQFVPYGLRHIINYNNNNDVDDDDDDDDDDEDDDDDDDDYNSLSLWSVGNLCECQTCVQTKDLPSRIFDLHLVPLAHCLALNVTIVKFLITGYILQHLAI